MGPRSYSPVRRAFYYCSNLGTFNATRTRVNWAIYNKEFEKNHTGKSGILLPRFWHICLVPYKKPCDRTKQCCWHHPREFWRPARVRPAGFGDLSFCKRTTTAKTNSRLRHSGMTTITTKSQTKKLRDDFLI